MTLESALLIDLVTVLGCVMALILRGDLRHSHPAVLYLGFHVLVFSLRAYGVSTGGSTYFETTHAEIARALNFADAFLVSMVVGWMISPRTKVSKRAQGGVVGGRDSKADLLSRRSLALGISAVAIPISLFVLLRNGILPDPSTQEYTATGYAQMPATWFGACLGMLAYLSGIKPRIVVAATVYFAFVAVQGASRYLLVLVAILLIQIYLDRRGRRWPTVRAVSLTFVLFLVFFPMKDVARVIQQGATAGEIQVVATDSVGLVLRGQDEQQRILDQLAITLSLSDASGKLYLGEPYAKSLLLPVPRTLWPEKPTLNEHLLELSRGSPLAVNGGVTTLPGDLYLNFGFVGMLLGGIILGRISGGFFARAYEDGYGSVRHFIYLLFAAAAVQIFRDGLVSVMTFVFIKNLPVLLFLAASIYLARTDTSNVVGATSRRSTIIRR